MLYPLLNKVWEQEQVPEDWKKGHMVKLPKKGDMSSCNNWRGIMLLSIPDKVLTRIILERLKMFSPQQETTWRAGRFLPRQLMYWPHCHNENHHWIIVGEAEPPIFGIRRLPEGLWQYRQRNRMEINAALQVPTKVYNYYSTAIWKCYMPSDPRRKADRAVLCTNWGGRGGR